MGQVDAGLDAGTVDSVDAGVISPLDGLYASCPAVEFADGGSAAPAIPVKRTGSFIEELPSSESAHADYLLPYPRPQRLSCKLAACEERVLELDGWGRSLNLPLWASISIAVTAAALGAWGMYEVCTRLPVLCGGR